ncbi:hypothetical protein RSAG8_09212, partial [Rhizoctonia solani AG-8 WAC10335]
MSSIVGWNSYPRLHLQSSMRLPTLPLPMTTYRTPYPSSLLLLMSNASNRFCSRCQLTQCVLRAPLDPSGIHNVDSILRKHSTRRWSHELALTCSTESVQPSELTPGSYLGS